MAVVEQPYHPQPREQVAPRLVDRARLARWARAAVALAGVVVAIGLLVWGYYATASPVALTVDGFTATVYTHERTLGEVLAEIGLVLQPEDRISADLSTSLGGAGEPLAVTVQRARPLVVQGDSRLRTLRTHGGTLGEALAEAGIVLGPHDELALAGEPATLDTPLPAVALDGLPRRPGIPPNYPWHGISQRPVEVSLRRALPMVVEEQGLPITLWTTASTVGEALAQEGLLFYTGDLVQPGLGTPVSAGLRIYVERSKPVTIRSKNGALATRTRADSVSDFLAEQGLLLTGMDRIEPALESALLDDMEIKITRVQQAYEIEDDVTRYATVWEPDPELEIDNWRLDLEGANGILRHRYRVTLEDGEPITRTLEDSWMAQQPVTRTYKYGTQIVMRELETADGPVSYWRKIRMFATSYSPANSGQSPDAYYYGLTRLGDVVQRGVVAVDPTVVNLGSRVYVPGYGFAKASDTGGGVKGRWIDLGFSDRDIQAWSRCAEVYLLGPPPPSYAIDYRLPDTPKTSCLTR